MAVSQEVLARKWNERVASGTFSPAVLGVGTIRVMGRSGDAPVAFPRLATLDALGGLAPDEQWAVRVAQQIVAEALESQRPVLSAQPGLTTPPTSLHAFEPTAESLIIASLIRGG